MKLSASTARRVEDLPHGLRAEFPAVPLEAIAREVELRLGELIATARFDDFVPLLVRRTVREQLRANGVGGVALRAEPGGSRMLPAHAAPRNGRLRAGRRAPLTSL